MTASRWLDHVGVGDFADLPAVATVPKWALFSAQDVGIIYQSDGAMWNAWATITATGLTDPPTITYVDGTGAAAPADPSAGVGRMYVKSDERWYSRDSAGIEYGPFDAAGGGGGGGLYVVDDTFPGSSLPGSWAYTGGGSAVVSGNKAHFVATASTDRLMVPYTDTGKLFVVRAHLKSLTSLGGMPSLVALDASGNGCGVSPYNDGSTYGWNVGTYVYSGTNRQLSGTNPATDIWLELMVNGGEPSGAGISTDGVTWAASKCLNPNTPRTITQVGICSLNGATTADLWELTITEP